MCHLLVVLKDEKITPNKNKGKGREEEGFLKLTVTAGYQIFSYIKAHTFFPKEMEIKTTKEVSPQFVSMSFIPIFKNGTPR